MSRGPGEGGPGRLALAGGDPVTRALVFGLARSGVAASLALRAVGVPVVAADRAGGPADGRLAAAGVEVHLGVDDRPALLHTLLEGVDLLVKSPGIANEAPLLEAARGRGLPIWSEIELGARLLPNPIVGITGTNGKTTTTELVGAIFRAGARPVQVAGNVGRPLTSLVGVADPGEWIVCELSSFQLEHVETLRPRVGALLNLTPDHLDRHGTLEAYREAKLRLFARQRESDTAVVPRGFGPLPGHAARVEFAADDPLPAEPRIPGRHNRENAAAASAVCRAAGLDEVAIATGLATFAGVPHRLEPLGEIAGVAFVNDSKATNPDSAERALEAFPGCRLIAGGSRKGTPFDALARCARRTGALAAYTIGETGEEVAAALAAEGVPVSVCGTLERAVDAALAEASAGDVVLLSPACASYDQYANFEERGAHLRRLVEERRAGS